MQLPDLSRADTTAKLLLHNAAQFGGEVALREKAFGIWHAYSWADSRDRVAELARGLLAQGIGRGDVVGIIGRNRPHWLWAELAAHSLGAMSLGIYEDALASEVEYLLGYAEAKIAFVEDEEQADKVLEIAGRLPALRWVVYNDPRGMRKYSGPPAHEPRAADRARQRPASRRFRAGGGRGPRRRGRGPVHDLGHDRAPQARDAPASPAARARPVLSARRAARALRRVRLDPAAALDRRAGLRRDHAAALAHQGQFPRAREHGDAGSARDRADACAVRAARLGADLGRRARPAARRQPPQPGGVRARGQDGSQGARRGAPLVARGPRRARRAARPPRPRARQVGGDRRLRARPRHLPLLPRAGRAAAPALRPDRSRRRLYGPDRRRARLRQLGPALRRHRDPHRRARQRGAGRGLGAPSRLVQGLLQAAGGDPQDDDRGRLAQDRRRRLFRRRRAGWS